MVAMIAKERMVVESWVEECVERSRWGGVFGEGSGE